MEKWKDCVYFFRLAQKKRNRRLLFLGEILEISAFVRFFCIFVN